MQLFIWCLKKSLKQFWNLWLKQIVIFILIISLLVWSVMASKRCSSGWKAIWFVEWAQSGSLSIVCTSWSSLLRFLDQQSIRIAMTRIFLLLLLKLEIGLIIFLNVHCYKSIYFIGRTLNDFCRGFVNVSIHQAFYFDYKLSHLSNYMNRWKVFFFSFNWMCFSFSYIFK